MENSAGRRTNGEKGVRSLIRGRLYPECFDSRAQYEDYIAAFNGSQEKGVVGYCTDCSPARKREMESALRCEHPETIFVWYETATGLEERGISGEHRLYRTLARALLWDE